MGEAFSYEDATEAEPLETAAPQTFSYEDAEKPETLSSDEASGIEKPGYLSNIGRGIGERTAQLAGGLMSTTAGVLKPLDTLAIDQAKQAGVDPEDLEGTSGHATAKRLAKTKFGYEPGTTWEDVKKSPLSQFLPFALEQGLVSAPDMAAVLTTLPGYVAARTGELGQQRAENDERPEATAGDLLKALPAATVSAFLERFGTKGVTGLDHLAATSLREVPKIAGKAALKEGSTEAAQNPIEYAGSNLGTKKGFDVGEAAEQALMGFVAGAPFGGGTRAAIETGRVALGPKAAPVANPAAEPQPGSTPAPTVPAAASSGRPVAPGYDVRYDTASQRFSVYGENGQPIRGGFKAPEEAADFTHSLAQPEAASTPDPNVPAAPQPNQAPPASALATASDQGVSPSAPEPAGDIQAQIQSMLDPSTTRDAVFVAEGNEGATPLKVPGAEVVRRPGVGLLITTDPEKAYRFLGKPDLNDADIQALLGYSQSKADAVRASAGADPVVVQAHTPDGGVAAEQVTAPNDVDAARAVIAGLAPDGSRIVETTPADALARRMRPAPTPADLAARSVNTDPSDAQKAAGNYAKGHLTIQGLPITIETPKGALRRGVGPDGTPWENESPAHYGYVKKTEGADGDHVDVYIGDQPDSDRVFIVDQFDPATGQFDEHKAVLGTRTVQQAMDIYNGGFSDGNGPERFRGVTEMSVPEFKAWLKEGDTKAPLAPSATEQMSMRDSVDGVPLSSKEIPGQSPIVRFRADAERINATVPPPKKGWTRLWRGNRPGEVGKNPSFTNDLAGIALPFREAYQGDLSYVDVPTADLGRFENRGAVAPGAEFTLPKGHASRATVVPTQDGQPQFSVRDEGKPLSDIAKTVRGAIHESRTARIPAERGAEAIKRRLRHQLQRDLEQHQAYGNVRPLTEPEVAEMESFIDFIGDKFFDDIGLSILPARGNVLGSYSTVSKIVSLYRSAIERAAAPNTLIHELWHTLERALSPADKAALTAEWRAKQAAWIEQNPWAKAFQDEMGYLRHRLTGREAEDWVHENITLAGTDFTPSDLVNVSWNDGKPTVSMRWTDANYRFVNPSEYFAEVMTDKYNDFARTAENPRAGGIMNWMRDLYQRMAAGLRRLFHLDPASERIFRAFQDQRIEGPLSDIGPIAAYGSLNSVQYQRAARDRLRDAIGALKRRRLAPDLPAVSDLGSFANWTHHPSTVASFYPQFTPVYETGLSMFAERDRTITALTKLAGPYLGANGADKKIVNNALELGRLTGQQFAPDATGRILVVNNYGDIGDFPYGSTLTLTPVQGKAYSAVRQTMDAALEAFRGQVLKEYGITAPVSAAELRIQAQAPNLTGSEQARLNNLADKIEEIENAAKAGYVPFSRYGTMGLTVTRDNPLGGRPEVVHFETIETDYGRGKLGKTMGRFMHKGKVADARQALQQKYPARDGYKVSQVKEIFPKQSPDDLDLNALDQLATIAGADPTAYEAVRQAIDKAIQEGSFKKHFFQSKHTPGYSTDFERSIADYVMGISGYIARRNHREAFDKSLRSVRGDKLPTLYKYAKDYIDYIQEPVEEWQNLRFMTFLYYLGGNVSSAMVNTTQVPVVTLPYLSQFAPTHRAGMALSRAYIDARSMLSWPKGSLLPEFDPEKAPADLKDAFRTAWNDGVMVPVTSLDQMALSNGRTPPWLREKTKAVQEVADKFTTLFTAAERINRIVTWIASHRLYRETGTPAKASRVLAQNARWFQKDLQASPADFANFVVDETQFRQGKVNRPRVMRGMGAPLLQFKGFTLNMLELMYKMARQNGPAAGKAAALFAGVMWSFAGLEGLPFAEDVRDAIEALYRKFSKKDVDLEQAAYDALYEMGSPSWIADALLRGPFRATGMDISRRVGMGQLVPRVADVTDIGMPFELTWGRLSRAMDFIAQQRYLEATAQGLPSAMANPLQSWAWSQNGVVTGAGNTTIAPDNLSGYDLALKALGVLPTSVARGREVANAQRRSEHSIDEYKRNLYVRFAQTISDGIRASQTNDKSAEQTAEDRQAELLGEISAYNETASPENQISLTNARNTINQRVQQNLRGRFAQKHRTNARGRMGDIEQSRAP